MKYKAWDKVNKRFDTEFFIDQDGKVHVDNYETCESQEATVGLETFLVPAPDYKILHGYDVDDVTYYQGELYSFKAPEPNENNMFFNSHLGKLFKNGSIDEVIAYVKIDTLQDSIIVEAKFMIGGKQQIKGNLLPEDHKEDGQNYDYLAFETFTGVYFRYLAKRCKGTLIGNIFENPELKFREI